LLGPIYRTLEWMGLLATSQFHFIFPRVEVSQDLVFSSQSNEGGRAVISMIVRILYGFQWKDLILDLICVPRFSL
jgi:hypothetical protein